MAQHYLLSSAACDFDREEIDCLDEEGAIKYLARFRWGEDGMQGCPTCGLVSRHIWRKRRRHWRCRECNREFSVTSGTVFQDRKMPVKKLLKAIYRYSVTAKGNPALELRRELKMSYKSAWLFTSKIREVLLRTRNPCQLSGLVHVDGGYFGGKPRSVNNHGVTSPEGIAAAVKHKYGGAPTQRARRYRNYKPGGEANERRKKEMRRLVYVFRQVSEQRGYGGLRTIIAVVHRDNEIESDAIRLIQKYVAKGSTIMTDECHAYRRLSEFGYTHLTVLHKKQWVNPEGVNENQAESFFSRMRRSEYGVFHRYVPTYLKDYANETAWREDTRKQSVRQHFEDLLHRIFLAGMSRWFRGYYQPNPYVGMRYRRPELLDL